MYVVDFGLLWIGIVFGVDGCVFWSTFLRRESGNDDGCQWISLHAFRGQSIYQVPRLLSGWEEEMI